MTTVLNAWSIDYPSISNRIRASIYVQSAPQALVATIIDTTPGHPARIWSFPGLPRNNYGFLLDEIDISNNVVRNIAKFDVVPGEYEGKLIRGDEQIQVGTTPGFDAGLSSIIFDGHETSVGSGLFLPDYRGWDITVSELTGRGIMVKGQVDYTWNKYTGLLSLLIPGDVLPTGLWYNIHFDPLDNPIGNSYPTLRDFEINLITVDTVLDASYFGNKLLIDSSNPYIEITLPDPNTVVKGRPLMVETALTAFMYCVKFIHGTTQIKFVRGDIYMLPGESLWIYRYDRAGVPEWRVSESDGNFKTVGQNISHDSVQADMFNARLMDGYSADKFQYARIYNELVLHLPFGQVVSYDNWSTGNNKYYFSIADSLITPNKFRFPDRRSIFERNNYSGKAGDYGNDTVGAHDHLLRHGRVGSIDNNPLGGGWGDLPGHNPIDEALRVLTNAGAETLPKHYLINKYVLI